MHHIKKYANGRLYDITYKKYINMEEVENYVRTGIPFSIVFSKTGEDITDLVIAKIKREMKASIDNEQAKIKPKAKAKISPKKKVLSKEETVSEIERKEGILSQLILKGGETLSGCVRLYADLWHGSMTLAEEQFEKRINQLVKAKALSESEAGRIKKEIIDFARNFKNWVGTNLEDRMHDIISSMNLATRSQVDELAEKIDDLNKKLAIMERMEKERDDATEEILVENEK